MDRQADSSIPSKTFVLWGYNYGSNRELHKELLKSLCLYHTVSSFSKLEEETVLINTARKDKNSGNQHFDLFRPVFSSPIETNLINKSCSSHCLQIFQI